MMKALIEGCQEVGEDSSVSKIENKFIPSIGMVISPTNIVRYVNGQGNIRDQLRSVGSECIAKHQHPPNLYVVVLPEGGNEVYTAVKQCVTPLFSIIFSIDGYFLLALEILRSVCVN
jgi:eukaryotic translation initiation factor 2C